MQITNVKIKNFRSLKDISLNLQKYSILVGANNVGKSNVIDAIRFFFGQYSVKENDKTIGSSENEPIQVSITFELTDREIKTLPENHIPKLKNGNLLTLIRSTEKSGLYIVTDKDKIDDKRFFGI